MNDFKCSGYSRGDNRWHNPPPTNRQLLDLLFTLVFMLDEFPVRSVVYELSSYRQNTTSSSKVWRASEVANTLSHFAGMVANIGEVPVDYARTEGQSRPD